VYDTGIGIGDRDLARLFERWMQAGSTLARRHHGTGLGLAISAKLVELHHGRIWVKSMPGVGSIFGFSIWLSLPTETASSMEESLEVPRVFDHAQSAFPSPALPIVVDLNQIGRKAIASLLTSLNHDCWLQSSIAEALNTANRLNAGYRAPIVFLIDENVLHQHFQRTTNSSVAESTTSTSPSVDICSPVSKSVISSLQKLGSIVLLTRRKGNSSFPPEWFTHTLRKPIKLASLDRVLNEITRISRIEKENTGTTYSFRSSKVGL
jgi:hypothetical protein